MRLSKIYCFLLSLFLVMVTAARTQGNQELLEDMLKHWKILEEAGSHLEVSFTLRHPPTSSGKQPLPQSGKFFIDGMSLWMSSTTYVAMPPQFEIVRGKNKQYAFTLSRRDHDAPYLLDYLGTPSADFDRQLFQEMNDHHGCTVPWNAQFKPLNVWLKEPGFSILALHEEQQSGTKRMCMDCSYRPPDGGKNRWFSHMTVWLDPNNHYRVDSYEADIWSGKALGKVDYGPNDGDLPVPVRNTITFVMRDKGDRHAAWICNYHEWKYRKKSTPDGTVGLSAFGLPEPMGSPTPPPSHTWLWLLAAAIAAAMLAIFFARLKRRHTVANSAKI